MRHMTKYVVLAGALALSACSDFNHEAGSQLDTGNFGNATMNNTLMQTGQMNYAISLTQRFAREVPNTVNFAFNSAVLDGASMAALDQQANWIRQFPEIRFRVYGHTDLVGGTAYNKSLGLKRAQAVVAYLGARGISRARLEAVVSYGKTQPLVFTQGPEARNRRTVTEVSGFVKAAQGSMDGQYAAMVFREYVASSTSASTTQTATGQGGGG